MEALEYRFCLTAPEQHVLIVSIDSLHAADVTDPQLKPFLTNIRALERIGVSYANDSTTSPSDSFPATMSYVTGANPATTGVYYDDTYSRAVRPGLQCRHIPTRHSGQLGQQHRHQHKSAQRRRQLRRQQHRRQHVAAEQPGAAVYPSQFLKVNTIFDVAHDAGLYTALIEKHPSYEIA